MFTVTMFCCSIKFFLRENTFTSACSATGTHLQPSCIVVQHLTDRVSGYVHAHTLYSSVRPFGVSMILGSYTVEEGPQMYLIDPSGVSWVRYYCFHLRWGLKVLITYTIGITYPTDLFTGISRVCNRKS